MAERNNQLATLFGDWPETIIWTCLEGKMGKVFVDDRESPRSALALYGRQTFFAFLAGEPHSSLLKMCEGKDVIMVPLTQAWSDLIEETYSDRVYSFTRYATKKNTVFDRGSLQEMVEDLPDSFELRQIDQELYATCLTEDWSRDLVANYADARQFAELGLGYVLLQGNQIVAGASSYSSYEGGIEVEVDTRADFRQQGLATVCAARLILACLDRGLYPSWDAHTETSLHLAEKLGYELDRPYQAYEWR